MQLLRQEVVGERRVSVVRDAAAVWRVLNGRNAPSARFVSTPPVAAAK